MNQRIERLKKRLKVDTYPICVEKSLLVMESYRQTEGEPQIVRRAKATAHYLDKKTIFIEDEELVVGNVASKPMGIEAGTLGPTWPKEDLDELKKEGWRYPMGMRPGSVRWTTTGGGKGGPSTRGRGTSMMMSGCGLSFSRDPSAAVEKERRGARPGGSRGRLGSGAGTLPHRGRLCQGAQRRSNKIVQDAEEELRKLRYMSADDVKKADFLRSVIIADKAIVRIAHRFGDLATEMASRERDAGRRKELERIAETCHWVPGNPARTFYEAMQSFWFTWLMVAGRTTPGGRFDQFMYPFYKKDKTERGINDDDVLELLECLRIKVMQFNFVGGGKLQREKWSGMARWHNWVIGGVTPDGEDATNEPSLPHS